MLPHPAGLAILFIGTAALVAPVEVEDDNATTVHELGAETLRKVTGSVPAFWRETQVAEIVKGYGNITRLRLYFYSSRGDSVTCENAADSNCHARAQAFPAEASQSGSLTHVDVIVKRFAPKEISTVGDCPINISQHKRFLGTHLTEAAVYNIGDELIDAGLLIPKLYHITEVSLGSTATFILEDMTSRFPLGANGQFRALSSEENAVALRWLAGFHAHFWENPRTAELEVWKRGSYWHLDELGLLELASIPDEFSNKYITKSEWHRLRGAAVAIDMRLAGRAATPLAGVSWSSARHRTLLHGDPKPENILCSSTSGPPDVECAFIDFSWTGEGYAMYDVMYLLWDARTQSDVEDQLKYYHETLMKALANDGAADYTFEVMRREFELCVLDFIRWWVGHDKGTKFWAMPWALRTLREVLSRLDEGQILTESEYAEAVDREFPLVH